MQATELREPWKYSAESGDDHNILGWPVTTTCLVDGKSAIILHSTYEKASYECRGNPVDPTKSVYGPDRCGAVFQVERSAVEKEC